LHFSPVALALWARSSNDLADAVTPCARDRSDDLSHDGLAYATNLSGALTIWTNLRLRPRLCTFATARIAGQREAYRDVFLCSKDRFFEANLNDHFSVLPTVRATLGKATH
jgi:hypothetical protein